MGFMRKAAIVTTGGFARAAIKPNSKKERTANAAEKALKLQKAEVKRARRDAAVAQAVAARAARQAAPVSTTPQAAQDQDETTAKSAPGWYSLAAGHKGYWDGSHWTKFIDPPDGASEAESDVAGPTRADTGGMGSAPSLAAQIKELADLNSAGMLSDDEFSAAKARLIAG